MNTPKLTELVEKVASQSFSASRGMTSLIDRMSAELTDERVLDLFAELKLAGYPMEWAIFMRFLPKDDLTPSELMRATVHYALDNEALVATGCKRDRQTGRVYRVEPETASA